MLISEQCSVCLLVELHSRLRVLTIVSRDIRGLQGCTSVRLDPDNDEKVVGNIELFVSARVDELFRIEWFNDKFRVSV